MGEKYWIHSDPSVDGDTAGQLCARGRHCASRDEKGIPPWGPRAFCEPDRTRIQAVLGPQELPALYRELGARIGDKKTGDGPRVSGGGKTPPVPINLATDAFMRLTVDIVLSWEQRVRAAARLADTDPPRNGDHTAALDRACRTLAAHIDTLLGLEPDGMRRYEDIHRREHLPEDAQGVVHPSAGWIEYNTNLSGADAGIELLNLHHRALARLGYKPQHVQLLSRCWDCGGTGKLVRRDGTAGLADEVTCNACRTVYVGPRLAHLMADEERILAEGRKAS
jgi:hypothetical protein